MCMVGGDGVGGAKWCGVEMIGEVRLRYKLVALD